MESPDKNAHLSPLLSRIKDYGPGEPDPDAAAAASDDVAVSDHAEAIAPEIDPSEPAVHQRETAEAAVTAEEAVRSEAPARPSGKRWVVYGLVLLWLLTLAAGFGAFVWQQTRVDELTVQLDEVRDSLGKRATAAEREAQALAGSLAGAEADAVALREALAEAESRTVQLPTEVVDTSPPSDAAVAQFEEIPAPDQDGGPVVTAEHSVEDPVEPAKDDSEAVPSPLVADGWFVNLSTLSTEPAAVKWLEGLQDPPNEPEIVPVRSDDGTLYRVRIGGFPSRDDATRAAQELSLQWRLSGVWVSKR